MSTQKPQTINLHRLCRLIAMRIIQIDVYKVDPVEKTLVNSRKLKTKTVYVIFFCGSQPLSHRRHRRRLAWRCLHLANCKCGREQRTSWPRLSSQPATLLLSLLPMQCNAMQKKKKEKMPLKLFCIISMICVPVLVLISVRRL